MKQDNNKNDPVESARAEERRRIASELHDRVLQALANVALRLEAARKQVLKTETGTRNDLRISEADVRSSIREIRGVIASGDNKAWQAGTLLEKIRDEVHTIETNSGLEIRVRIDPPELALHDSDLEYDVFQVTREGLRNVVRHAHASQVHLDIATRDHSLQVSLSDNGQGFDRSGAAGAEDRTGRYGLESMRSRVERLGGTMTIRSETTQGTTLSFTVPMSAPERGRGKAADRGNKHGSLRFWLGSTVVAGAVVGLFLVFLPLDNGRSRTLGVDVLGSAVTHYNRVSKGLASHGARRAGFDLLDLSPWGFKILSKKVRQVDGVESRAFVYQSEATKDFLVAEEFDGVPLPTHRKDTVEASGTAFATYTQEGIQTVAWNENDILCVLTSSIPERDLLDLAQRMNRERLTTAAPR